MKNPKLIKEIISLQQESNRILSEFPVGHWLELNLTIAQLKCLFFIANKERTNFKKLAEALGVTPPNITGIVDRLVEDGLVDRAENPEDRRVNLLQITLKGRELLNNLQDHKTERISQILVEMRDDELTSLTQGLQALLKAAKSFNYINKQS